MAALEIYIQNHGYSDSDYVYVSWLDGNYYVQNATANTFQVSSTDDTNNIVQYSAPITYGYVRLVTPLSTTISGLDHLEGEVVTAMEGESIIGYYTVSSGSITLPRVPANYRIGLPYRTRVRTMRLAIPMDGNTVQTRVKRIHEIATRYYRTKNGQHGLYADDTFYHQDMNCTYSDRSKDAVTLAKGGFDEDGFIQIQTEEPFPMTILATVISFEVYETR